MLDSGKVSSMLMDMWASIGKILSSLFRSLFVSIVMLVIVLSIITGDFPPDLGKLTGAYTHLQEIKVLENTTPPPATDSFEEGDLRQLEAINEKRRDLGGKILPHGSMGVDLSQEKREVSRVGTPSLENKVRELQQDVFRLQERLHRLEERAREGER